MNSYQNFDLDLRHFIYRIFALTAHPPTSQTMAEHFNCSLTKVEVSLTRLAEAHQIALAPGTYSVWMAHPFSSIPTNYIAKVDTKEYWGN